MLNPVSQMLFASDLVSRFAAGETFMLAMKPGETVPKFVEADMRPWVNARMVMPVASTSHDSYVAGLNDVIALHKKRGGGKTVISRVKVADAPVLDADWWQTMLGHLFGGNDNALRYVANTRHGLWIGATPEVLAHVDMKAGMLDTMALAGTRPYELHNEPWDNKNIYENSLVGKYIVEKLEGLGLSPTAAPVDSLPCNDIEHLIQRISAPLNGVAAGEIIEALNPTPALAGSPLHEALDTIRRIEAHDRMYYGGIIVIDTDDCIDAYVNLRCCCISGGKVVAFGGGGITADSDAETEWDESERKMSVMLRDTIF